MKVIEATVKKNPRTVTTKYGERTVINAVGNDQKEYTVWRPAKDPVALGRKDGERIQIGVDSKGKTHLLETLSGKVVESSQPTYEAHNGRSAQIADYARRMTKLYRFCYENVGEEIEGLSEESQRTIATSIFIQTSKRFNL